MLKLRNNIIFLAGRKMHITTSEIETLRTTGGNREELIVKLMPGVLGIANIYIKTNKHLKNEITSEAVYSLIVGVDALARGSCQHTEYYKYLCSRVYGDIKNMLAKENLRHHISSGERDVPGGEDIVPSLSEYGFTPFELQVIDLRSKGKFVKDIARELHVGRELVCATLQNIETKILA